MMKLSAGRLLGALVLAACAGCPDDGPTPEDGAAYFGLEDGATRTYERGGQEEIHTITASTLSGDGLVFDVVAAAGGFVVPERSFSLDVTGEQLSLVRFGECVVFCGQPDAPLPVLPWPLQGGETVSSEASVEVTEGGQTRTEAQNHRFLVTDPADVTVPAGTFTGFTIGWSRTIDGTTTNATLVLVEGEGFVSFQGFDGAQLLLKP